MPAYCQPTPSVTALLERHTAAWTTFDAAIATGPDPHTERSSNKLCNIDSDLRKAAPASMAEFFAKWRQVARFDTELGDPSDTHVPYITRMLNELQAINGRWCEP